MGCDYHTKIAKGRMVQMRILLGVTNMGQQEAKIFVDGANENGANIRSYETKTSKLGIEQYLASHPDTDVVIVSEWLESRSVYDVPDFEKMIEANEKLKIIPILGENVSGTDKIKGIFNLGIYTALFAKDASAEQVAKMIIEGRSRKAAKAYYNIQDSEGVQFGANIQQCVTFICEDGMRDGILDRAQYVKEHVELPDYQVILSKLPEDVKALIRDAGEDLMGVALKGNTVVAETDETPAKKKEGTSVPATKAFTDGARQLFKKSQSLFKNPFPRKEEDNNAVRAVTLEPSGVSSEQLKELLVNVAIAFVGTQRRVGCTHQAIIAAHYLQKAGYRVAIADCTKTNGKTFDAIGKHVPCEAGKGFFTYRGVDYYSNITPGMTEIFTAKEKYNFIVIDGGTFDRTERDVFTKAAVKCVVAGAMPWEIGALNSFTMEAKALLGECNFIVRGASIDRVSVNEMLANASVIYAEIQEDPFSGECYASLRSILEPYTLSSGVEAPASSKDTKQIKKQMKSASKGGTTSVLREGKVRKVGTASVYVTSLKRGCGNTHFAAAAANYISRKGQEVCLVSNASGVGELIDEQVDVRTSSQVRDEIFANSDYLVFDEGMYSELSGDQVSQCKRADYKIMMCWADDDYMTKLANFVSKQKDEAENWVFVFNNVPPRKINEIKRVMNRYFSCFLPLFEAEDPDKDAKKILKEIFG